MFDIVIHVVSAIALLFAGILIGVRNVVTVDEAIKALKVAEVSAQATLAKITTHKTS